MRKTRKIVRLECHKKRAFALFATKMTRFPSAKCLFLPSRQPLVSNELPSQNSKALFIILNEIMKCHQCRDETFHNGNFFIGRVSKRDAHITK